MSPAQLRRRRIARMAGGSNILGSSVFACRAYGSNGVLTDLSPYRRAIQHGSAAGADSNDPLWLPYTGTQYIHWPGVGGNFASLSYTGYQGKTTGTITLISRVRLADYTPSTTQGILGSSSAAALQLSCLLTSGLLRFTMADSTGTSRTATSSVAPTATDDVTDLWVRAVYDFATNQVTFSTGTTNTNDYTQVAWSALGTAQTLTSFDGTVNSSIAILVAGQGNDGTTAPITGRTYTAVWLNDSTVAAHLDFTDQALLVSPFTSFVEKSANAATVTINRAATGRKSVVVDRDDYLFGTDDYDEVADNALLNFALTDSFTICKLVRLYGTTANQVLIAKKTGALAAATGWVIDRGTANACRGIIADGTNLTLATGPALTQGVLTLVSLVRNVAADTLTVYADEVPGTPVADTTTGTILNTEVMRIGRYSGAGTSYGDFEFPDAAIFRRVLTTAELARVKNALLGLPGY